MKGETLRIEIDEETGEVEVTAGGFVGKGCSAVQDALSKELGTVVETKTTGDYYKTATVKRSQTTGR